MKGTRPVLIIGLLLVLVSYVLGWYAAGGNNARLAFDDYRVEASLEYLAEDSHQSMLATAGRLQSAWLSADSRGYRVNLRIDYNDFPWLATVVFAEDASPLGYIVKMTGGLPSFLRRLGLAMVALWLVAGHILPRLLLPKCPDCLRSFLRPHYLEPVETYVYPGGFDDDGDSLPPIIRVDHVCPECGFRRVTYRTDAEYRVGKIFRSVMTSRPMSLKHEMFVESVLDKFWETHPKKTRFHNQEEWRAFYDELKASEHEGRGRS